MKKLILLFCVFYYGTANAQLLTLSDLRYLVQHDISSCNSYLINKGWTLYEHNDTTQSLFENFTVSSWGYQIDQSERTALGWVYINQNDTTFNRIRYPFTSNVIYRTYLNELKSLKTKKLIGDPKQSISDIFFGKSYVYVIETVPKNSDNANPQFYITVFDKKDYLHYWVGILQEKNQ